jgi:hypothetical protein
MYIVTQCKQVCGGCPSSWDAKTECGENLHIKYRYGCLRVWTDAENELKSHNLIFAEPIGGELDGVMSYDDMRHALRHHLNFICQEAYEMPSE